MAICAGPTCTLNAIRDSPSTATERELLAHPVPRISIGRPAISLKQHWRGHHRETSGSMTTSCVAGGCPYSRYLVLQRAPELRRRTAGRICVHRRQFRPGRRREFVTEGGWIVRQRRRLRRQDLEWSCQVAGAEESRARKGAMCDRGFAGEAKFDAPRLMWRRLAVGTRISLFSAPFGNAGAICPV